MADTRADVIIPAGVWTDVTTASSVAAGTACNIYNKGSGAVFIATKATEPSTTTAGIPLTPAYNGTGHICAIAAGTAKVWAYSVSGTTVLQQD